MPQSSHAPTPASNRQQRGSGALTIVLGFLFILAAAAALGAGRDPRTAEHVEAAVAAQPMPQVAASSVRPAPAPALRDRLDSEYLREVSGAWAPTAAPVDPALLESQYLREILGGARAAED